MMNKKRLELYIHIPFCIKKCDYCDFLSAPAQGSEMRQYTDALLKEIKARGRKDYLVKTIFIGGGTPSILESGQIREIMHQIQNSFRLSKRAEVTIEANPGTLDKNKLEQYLNLGINRLSIGLQTTVNQELIKLGRIHTYEEFLESYRLAREAGFQNINIDLMSSLPGQTKKSWQATLEKVIALKPEHISAYSLIIEEETPFFERYGRGEDQWRPDEDEERQMYYLARDLLRKYGYYRYEISNYARYRKECKHNIGYWTGTEYLGLGLGAASCFGQNRFSNTREMDKYIQGADNPDNIMEDVTLLDKNAQMEEFMFLGLRLTNGVSMTEFSELFQLTIGQIYGEVLEKLMSEALIIQEADRIKLTDYGCDVSNYVLAKFLL